ncbi:pheromone precursor [Trametes sanguinea]|nr:pheromone precursor [Trametes sanguinea]
MDAFFTIAAPVPVEEPTVEDVLVDSDAVGTNGSHGSCVIA